MRLLFVARRLPHPEARGYQVRAFHQLRLLAPRHRVTLVALGADEASREDVERVAALCERLVAVPFRLADAAGALVRGALSGRPLQAVVHEVGPLRSALAELRAGGRFDCLHVQLARLAGAAGEDASVPRVVDLVDALSRNMRRRAERDRGPMRLAAALEARRLERWERRLCARWDAALVVSAADREAIGDFPSLVVNPNGVDLDRFRFDGRGRDADTLVFTGNLGYFPNADGLAWFVREVLPALRRSRPGLRLLVAGRGAGGRLRRLLAADRSVVFAGAVPDLAGPLGAARVAVAPLLAGSGQSFKVLEAMAAGTPVVATPAALEGIDPAGEHALVAADAASFAAAVERLLADAALAGRLAARGRALVEQRFRWEASVAGLEAVYERVAGSGVTARAAAAAR